MAATHINESLLVGVHFREVTKDDTGVLIVGRRRMNGTTEIINAFQGEEALELYNKLTTKKEGE